MSTLNKTLTTTTKSTNFNIQLLLLLLYAALETIGFPIPIAEEIKQFIEATILAGAGFWGYIRAWLAKGIKLEYTSNILTYIFAFIGGVVEWFGAYAGELQGAVGGLIEALQTGNFNLIFPALFALGNIIYRITRDKPWLNPA